VIRCNDIALFFQTLRERKQNRDKLAAGHIPSLQETQKQPLVTVINYFSQNTSKSMKLNFSQLFRRLVSEGMDEDTEEYLLIMSDHLTKIHQRKLNLASNQGKKHHFDGVVSLLATQ
jgi:hypothetical protein